MSGAFGGEGLSTFSVQAVDAAGLTSDWAPACAVTYDATAPASPTLQLPANNAYLNNNNFWFDWSDSTGASGYEFQASQSSATDGSGSLSSGVWHGDASGTEPTESRAWSSGANGVWYWQVRAVDMAGNKSAWTPAAKLTIDLTAPVATITNPTGGSVRGLVNLTGTVSDDNPMNSYFSIYNASGTLVSSSLYTDGRTTHDFSWNTDAVPEGEYTIYFETRDKAGNKDGSIAAPGASVKKVMVTVDRTNPVVSLDDIAAVTEGANTVITGLVTDETSAQVEVFVGGASRGLATVTGSTFRIELTLSEGTHEVFAKAVDAVGNNSSTSPKTALVQPAPVVDDEDEDTPVTPVVTPSAEGDNGELPQTTTDQPSDTNQIFTAPIVALGDQAVLGEQDEGVSDDTDKSLAVRSAVETDNTDVKGAEDVKTAQVFSPLGLAWFWWLLILAGIVTLWWILATARRRNPEQN